MYTREDIKYLIETVINLMVIDSDLEEIKIELELEEEYNEEMEEELQEGAMEDELVIDVFADETFELVDHTLLMAFGQQGASFAYLYCQHVANCGMEEDETHEPIAAIFAIPGCEGDNCQVTVTVSSLDAVSDLIYRYFCVGNLCLN